MSKEIRTRFAPSPTGFLHVGGARTALFNFLYAKAKKGKFIIRVEDTDQVRSTPESERLILDSLAWLGIMDDEGPDSGGAFGSYRQSERLELYSKYTDKLIKEKLAYPCFCSDQELEAKQAQSKALGVPHIYDGKCRGLLPEEVEKRKKAGERFAIRFVVNPGEVTVNDHVQGKVRFDSRLIGDFIIVKSDGFPSYNYAVVIDDYEMKISHVIRGVGHLSNTPRQILVHEALGLPLPEYAHISEIVGTDRKKLSKRKGATSVLFFRDLGYLPEAFVNYMALLGWYPEDAIEFMNSQELQSKFDIDRCSKSPAMFDFFLTDGSDREDFNPAAVAEEDLAKYINNKTKLNWLNNKYIRSLPLDRVWDAAQPFLMKDATIKNEIAKDEAGIKSTVDTLRVYLNTLKDIVPYLHELVRHDISIENEEAAKILDDPLAGAVLDNFAKLLKEKSPSSPEEYTEIMKATGAAAGAKGKTLFMTIRVASTGSMHGLELPVLFTILGKENVLKRIERILAAAKSAGRKA